MGVFRGLSPLKGGLGVSPSFKISLPEIGRGLGMVENGISDNLTRGINFSSLKKSARVKYSCIAKGLGLSFNKWLYQFANNLKP